MKKLGRSSENQVSVNFSVDPQIYLEFRKTVVRRENKSRHMSVVVEGLMSVYNVMPGIDAPPDEAAIRMKTAAELLVALCRLPDGYDLKISVVSKPKLPEPKPR